jgi:hypothetical protein
VADQNDAAVMVPEGKTHTNFNSTIRALANSKIEELSQQNSLITAQTDTLTGVMRFYLREEPLTAVSRKYLTEHGVSDDELDTELQRREDAKEANRIADEEAKRIEDELTEEEKKEKRERERLEAYDQKVTTGGHIKKVKSSTANDLTDNYSIKQRKAFGQNLLDYCRQFEESKKSHKLFLVLSAVKYYAECLIKKEDVKTYILPLQKVRQLIQEYKKVPPSTKGLVGKMKEQNIVLTLDRFFDYTTNGSLKLESAEEPKESENPEIPANVMAMDSAVTWADRKDYPLFTHEPCVDDIEQGYIGDCYLLAALSSLAMYNPQKIKDSMRDDGDTVTVRFFDFSYSPCIPIYVKVRKSVPVGSSEGDLFAKKTLWVQMIEKAYVCSGLHGNVGKNMETKDKKRSYDDISGGYTHLFMQAFTGKDSVIVHNPIIKVINGTMPESKDIRTFSSFEYTSFKRLTGLEQDEISGAIDDCLEKALKGVAKKAKLIPKDIIYGTRAVTVEDILNEMKILLPKLLGGNTAATDDVSVMQYIEALKADLAEEQELPLQFQAFSDTYSYSARDTFTSIKAWLDARKSVMATSTSFVPKEVPVSGGLNRENMAGGFAQGHSYSILGVEDKTPDSGEENQRCYVLLRNPWACGTVEYNQTELRDGTMQYESSASQIDNGSRGIFRVELNDFMNRFCDIFAT